jgi:hypothetical protein
MQEEIAICENEKALITSKIFLVRSQVDEFMIDVEMMVVRRLRKGKGAILREQY